MIDVFRKNEGIESSVCQISDKNAKLVKECMGKDEVTVSVVVDAVLTIRELDYIIVDGNVYTLNRFQDYNEISDTEFQYSMIFEGVIYNLIDKMYVYTLRNTDKFFLTATLREYAELLIENANSVDPGWTLGEIPDTDRKNIQFESMTCREVPNKLSGEFGVEYYLVGRQMNFVEKFENKTSLVFERGKGKGLYKVTCKNADSENTVTRVRVYGSTENLPVGYRDNQVDRLQLPMKNGLPTYYIEDYSEFKKIVEKTVHFDDIKPSFTGTVKTVSDEYNRRITCPEIDFDLKAVAIGDEARINFLSGDLTGVSFKFQWDNAKKEINLVRQEDEMSLPDAENKRPLIPHDSKKAIIGDKFNFTGISLPQSYINKAESDLLLKGTEWLSFYKQLRITIGLDIDHRYLRETGKTLNIGDVVTIKVPKLKLEKLLRILSIEKDLYSGKLSCTVSNYITESWEKKIEGKIQATQSNIDNISLNANYLVEASKEWVAKNFAKLFGGNRFIGDQVFDGEVELPSGRKLTIGDVILSVTKDIFHTIFYIKGKSGEDVNVDVAGVKTKKVTTGEISTPSFVSGFGGSGTRLKDDHLELDAITVRKQMTVRELMIEKVKAVGGTLIISIGAMKITAATDGGAYFKCSFDNDGGNIDNPFVVDDLVMCQTFSGSSIKRYWRRVTSVGVDYFNLSKTDCESGSAEPAAGDEIVQLGNRTDTSRQSAMILCAVGADAPYIDQYAGINNFTLAGKLITREGNLSGIVDDALGQLSGSGLYAKNAYLRGKLALASGKTVENALGEIDTKTGTAQSTAETAQQTANNAASELSKTNTTLSTVTRDVKLLADAQSGFSVSVSEVRKTVDNLQIGGVNYLSLSRMDSLNNWSYNGGSIMIVQDEKFGSVVEYSRPGGGGDFQRAFNLPRVELANTELVYYVIAKQISKTGHWSFGGWDITYYALMTDTANKIDLGGGWHQYWVTFKSGNTIGNGVFGINSTAGTWRFYAAGVLKGNKPTSWSLSLEDQNSATEHISQLKADAAKNAAISAANNASQAKIDLLKTQELANLDGKIDDEEARAIKDAQDKYDAAVSEAQKKALGASWVSGKILNDDPTFQIGTNGIGTYNNLGNGNVILTRLARLSDSPFDPGYNIQIKNTGDSQPGLGGFSFANQSRASARFICRFIAKIPIGYAVEFASNPIGQYGVEGSFWATPNAGTGKWEEYIYVVKCGASGGRFSTTNFYYLQGVGGTPSSPVSWYLAYASVFDITDGVNAQTEALKAVKNTDVVRTELNGKINVLNDSITSLVTKTEYNALGQRVSQAEGNITTLSDQISLKVSSSDFNALSGRVKTTESSITLLKDRISLLVKTGDIMTGIIIKPENIEITGATIFRDSANNQTFSVFGSGGYALNLNNKFKVTTAGKLYATDADITGRIMATSGEFTGAIYSNASGNRIEIDPANRRLIMRNAANSSVSQFYFFENDVALDMMSMSIYGTYNTTITASTIFMSQVVPRKYSTTIKPGVLEVVDNENKSGILVVFKGLKKVSATSDWDRMIVNTKTGEVAYG